MQVSKFIEAILVSDTREQAPYLFVGCHTDHVSFASEWRALDAGDYCARLADEDAPEFIAVVERKTHSDLLGTLTHGRERFERELERLRPYGFKALVIEADLPAIVRGTDHSNASPKSIIASLVAFSQRFGIHVVFATDRRHAEAYTFRLLERWVRDRAEVRKQQEVTA